MKTQFDRHFTLLEAREEIPWLRETLPRLQEELEALKNAHEAAEPAMDQAESNGGGPALGRYLTCREAVTDTLAEIDDRGIQSKDPWRGLVDFPHVRDGREVLLCWHLGEDDIHYWHDLDAGFPGRRPV